VCVQVEHLWHHEPTGGGSSSRRLVIETAITLCSDIFQRPKRFFFLCGVWLENNDDGISEHFEKSDAAPSCRHCPYRCPVWMVARLFRAQEESSQIGRQMQYPEQYPATYEMNTDVVEEDENDEIAKLVRPLLKNTQLQNRPLQLVYDANKHGWNAAAFHERVDGKGAAIVLCRPRARRANSAEGTTPRAGRRWVVHGRPWQPLSFTKHREQVLVLEDHHPFKNFAKSAALAWHVHAMTTILKFHLDQTPW
jgi:hypothetical protein